MDLFNDFENNNILAVFNILSASYQTAYYFYSRRMHNYSFRGLSKAFLFYFACSKYNLCPTMLNTLAVSLRVWELKMMNDFIFVKDACHFLPRFTRDRNLAKTTARQRKDWRGRNKKTSCDCLCFNLSNRFGF